VLTRNSRRIGLDHVWTIGANKVLEAHYSLTRLKRSRMITARDLTERRSVVLTLAFTIGIATAVFSLFDAVFLRPFPYPNANRLVRVRTYRQQGVSSPSGASVYDFRDWQKLNRSFLSLASYVSFNSNLTGTREAQVVRTTATSPELFKLLGIPGLLGRTFTKSEDEYRAGLMLRSFGRLTKVNTGVRTRASSLKIPCD
jgi:hypothetical protein